MKLKQIIAIFVLVVLILNFILLATRNINGLVFFAILVVGAIVAFAVIPKMKD
jgi:hypothetical protein